MKTLEMAKATKSLAKYARDARKGPVVLMANGKPVAALVIIRNADLETIQLSTNPKFMALIKRSRVRHRTRGGISSAEMRRRLGVKSR